MKYVLQLVMGIIRGFPLLCVVLLSAMIMQMVACSSTPLGDKKFSDTGVKIDKAKTTAKAQEKTLTEAKKTADGLTPQNLPAQKPLLSGQIGNAQGQNKDLQNDLSGAAKGAKADAAVIASSADPTKVRLQWFGYSALVLGIAALVTGFFFSAQLGTIAEYLRSGGAASAVTGILTLGVAYVLLPILHALFWIATILVGIGLVAAGLWVYLHRNQIIPTVESWFGKAVATVKKDVA